MNCHIGENIHICDSSKSQNENKCLEVSNSDTLCLKGQGLSKLPKKLENFTNVVSVILEENLFCDLPSELWLLQSVKVLNIAKNKINALPDEIGNLINLELLDVSKNNLEKLPKSLSMASKLHSLNVSNNKISEIPHEYKNLKKLTRINLAHNKLTEVPIVLTFGSHCISVLDLSHNSIKDFSNEPKCSTSLKVIKINNNFITDLPNWIRCLQTIEELHLGNNPFTMGSRQSLDNMIPLSSVTMKKFSVTSCGLTHLPACLDNMTNLLYFDAGNEAYPSNKSQSMCNAIWNAEPLLNLAYLRELRLPYVSLPVLPASFWKALKCLEVLDLRGNNLTWLPDGISSLFNLILCNLSNNRLALLPADIGNVKSVKELNLDGNKLSDLPDSFGQLEHLAYLDLYDNELYEFPLAISQLQCLKYLDVEMNYFSSNESSNMVPENLSIKYSAMKDRLRSFHLVQQNRIDGVKERPSSNESENGSCCQKSRNSSPENFVCQPDLHVSFHNCSIEDDEDWDKSDGSDNFFDPSYSQALKGSRGQWHWARDNGRWEPPVSGDVFCPADIHPDTLPRPSNKTETFTSDGQFDDADDMTD